MLCCASCKRSPRPWNYSRNQPTLTTRSREKSNFPRQALKGGPNFPSPHGSRFSWIRCPWYHSRAAFLCNPTTFGCKVGSQIPEEWRLAVKIWNSRCGALKTQTGMKDLPVWRQLDLTSLSHYDKSDRHELHLSTVVQLRRCSGLDRHQLLCQHLTKKRYQRYAMYHSHEHL